MNLELLRKHIAHYMAAAKAAPSEHAESLKERRERVVYYQGWTAERLRSMTAENLYEYLANLWAMRLWSNKHYVVDKMVKKQGLEAIRSGIATLVWGSAPIAKRWDDFRVSIKGMGPAMMSEILCHTHPDDLMIWNRRAFVALNELEVASLPRYDYQMTGAKYVELSDTTKKIASIMQQEGIESANPLIVDYFFWDELQVEENLSQMQMGAKGEPASPKAEMPFASAVAKPELEFIHDEVRDKLRDIGQWMGFDADTERKIADGSVVDTIWEATIGNMGRVVYVFEVQTKGSIDSLIVNLLKALNNPAVQGVVAVSDAAQIEKIKKHAQPLIGNNPKLRYWDYVSVLQVHADLSSGYEKINALKLVPEGYF